ncbi:MAG: hypothetical protein ACR2GY_06795 [Phycisphaerales bacterium]
MSSNYSDVDLNDGDLATREDEDQRVMPLGVGNFGTDATGINDFSESKKRFSSSTTIVALVIVLAAAGLFSMRSLAIAMASASSDKDIEVAVEEFLQSLSGRKGTNAAANSVVIGSVGDATLTLVDDRIERQVSLEYVQKNPFISGLEAKPLVAAQATRAQEDPAILLAKRQLERTADFERAAANFKVLMILGGNRSMANVGGTIVHVGDSLKESRSGETFKVIGIEQGLVTIVGIDEGIHLRHEIVLELHTDM